MNCKVCGSEMKYSRIKSVQLTHIGDFGCTGNEVRDFYFCDCGAHYEEFIWTMTGKNAITDKQSNMMKVIKDSFFNWSWYRGEKEKDIYEALNKEYKEVLTKQQASVFIGKYKTMINFG